MQGTKAYEPLVCSVHVGQICLNSIGSFVVYDDDNDEDSNDDDDDDDDDI